MQTATSTARPLTAFDRKRVDRVALEAFFKLAAEWGLSADDQLAGLPADTLERVSVLLGTYKALAILLPVRARAHAWVKRPNTAFGDRSALEVMRQGRVDDLYQVRRHLDAWRGE
jgi:hypothetical protein